MRPIEINDPLQCDVIFESMISLRADITSQHTRLVRDIQKLKNILHEITTADTSIQKMVEDAKPYETELRQKERAVKALIKKYQVTHDIMYKLSDKLNPEK
jgi:hypothetical protein